MVIVTFCDPTRDGTPQVVVRRRFVASGQPTSCTGRVRGSAAAYRRRCPAGAPLSTGANSAAILAASPKPKPAAASPASAASRSRSIPPATLGMPATCGGALRRARQRIRNPSAGEREGWRLAYSMCSEYVYAARAPHPARGRARGGEQADAKSQCGQWGCQYKRKDGQDVLTVRVLLSY